MKNVTKSNFAKTLLALSLSFAGASTLADKHNKDHASEEGAAIASKLSVGVIDQVGNYKLRTDNYGEPAMMPLRISVEIDCGTRRPFAAFTDRAACGGGELKKSKKDLVLSYLKPNEDEKCAQVVSETIALADICKK